MTLLIGPAAWADTSAFTLGSVLTNQPPSFTGTKGWAFINYGAGSYIGITQLGVFDSGGDGLANPHDIGLWALDGTLLASTTIPAGTAAPLVDGYRYMPITPVWIPAGSLTNFNSKAIIAAEYSASDVDDLLTPQTGGYAAGLDAVIFQGAPSYGRFGFGTGLPFPNRPRSAPDPEGSYGAPFWEVNFQFTVPEPSVPLLLAPGLLYLFVSHRYRKRNKRN